MNSLSIDWSRQRHNFAAVLLAVVLVYAVSTSILAAAEKTLHVIVQNGKYGYIDSDGKMIIPPQFIWADDFWQALGTVYVCGRYVSIDSSGTLLPLRITIPGRLEPWEKEGKYGFVDASGIFKIAPIYDDVLSFKGGHAAVRVEKKWGFVDTAGSEIIRPQFAAGYNFHEGVATAKLDSDSVLIDTTGKVIARGYEFMSGIVAEGRVPASRDERSGYLDLQGKIAIPFIYETVDTFSEGLAAVSKQGKFGYIDRDGKLVIPYKFDKAGQFSNGLAEAQIDKISGFIDRSGEFSFYLGFRHTGGFLAKDEEQISRAPSDVSRFWTEDGKFGIVNTSGKVIWGPIAESPDHRPLLGWSEEEKAKSCEGIPEQIKYRIATFPEP
jgi:hypothetical protein